MNRFHLSRGLLGLAAVLVLLSCTGAGNASVQAAKISSPGASPFIIEKNTLGYASPLVITDIRLDQEQKKYSDKENYDIHTLDIYRPKQGGVLLQNRPVVFFVHGGAWTDGYKDWYAFVANTFTGEKGWVTVVVDYRLTSDHVFLANAACATRQGCNPLLTQKAAWYPDNIQDVAAAFNWVKDAIAGYGGNPRQIAIFGHSAGGHLVSLLSTHPDYAALRPSIKAVVSMSGAYTLKDLDKVFFCSDLNQTFRGGCVNNASELDEASPASYVNSGVLPPTLQLLYAEQELPSLSNQYSTFSTLLQAKSAIWRGDYLPGYTHESEMMAIGTFTELPSQKIVNFLNAIFWPYPVFLPAVQSH